MPGGSAPHPSCFNPRPPSLTGEPEYERQVLFDVLNERYETRKPTLFLSNKTLDEFKVVMGERVMDRLREDGAPVVPFCWPSARGRVLR